MNRICIAFCFLVFSCLPVNAGGLSQEEVLVRWYKLVLNLVRHTATYSPPVASRAFAYAGIAAYEVTASANPKLISLQGQLTGLKELPALAKGKTYDQAVVLNAALQNASESFFSNTGPTGQRVLGIITKKMRSDVTKGVPADVVKRSEAFGKDLAASIKVWADQDGGAVIANLGFPLKYELSKQPGHWQPTNQQALQRVPLLPDWGKNRPFAMPQAATCELPSPPAFSEDPNSEFFKQAKEVHDVKNGIGEEQRAIARFWSDDPGLSVTPPGHWIEILLAIAERDKLPAEKTTDALARLGIAVADAFIGCWHDKFRFDSIRPVTFIKAKIDPKWETVLITPPFPEYPSGHSTASAAAAEVLSSVFGENFAFEDNTREKDGLGKRSFASFRDAAKQAAISRFYGGIHFRAAIEQGLVQGKCIGAYAAKLKTVK